MLFNIFVFNFNILILLLFNTFVREFQEWALIYATIFPKRKASKRTKTLLVHWKIEPHSRFRLSENCLREFQQRA